VARWARRCNHCTFGFIAKHSDTKYCSDKCRAAARGPRKSRWQRVEKDPPRNCDKCGERYQPRKKTQRYCSYRCKILTNRFVDRTRGHRSKRTKGTRARLRIRRNITSWLWFSGMSYGQVARLFRIDASTLRRNIIAILDKGPPDFRWADADCPRGCGWLEYWDFKYHRRAGRYYKPRELQAWRRLREKLEPTASLGFAERSSTALPTNVICGNYKGRPNRGQLPPCPDSSRAPRRARVD
jgi:predicted nucleic acid-binding Zn ribbon protein